MNMLTTIVAGMIALSTMPPAFARSDWRAIEQARQNHRTQVAQMEKLTAYEKCAVKRLVLPVEHGPRAQTTSYLNEQRKANFATELNACQEGASAGAP